MSEKEQDTFEALYRKIKSIVANYGRNKYPPARLIIEAKKLAGYLFFFNDYLVNAKKDHSWKYLIHKIETERSNQDIINAQLDVNVSLAKSQTIASENYKEHYKDRLDAEALAFKCQTIIKQGNIIIDIMRSEISLAKQEFKDINI